MIAPTVSQIRTLIKYVQKKAKPAHAPLEGALRAKIAPSLVVSRVTRKRFGRLVAEAVRGIPKRFRDEMANVAVVVDDRPSPELLKEMEVVAPDTLYGLYQGTPLPDRVWTHNNLLPDQITIYQGPIVEDSDDEDGIIRAIAETVIHEFGHYFGLSEEEIEEIESRYWRGETDADEESA